MSISTDRHRLDRQPPYDSHDMAGKLAAVRNPNLVEVDLPIHLEHMRSVCLQLVHLDGRNFSANSGAG